jgi:membrane associated rhomboid family serine protease
MRDTPLLSLILIAMNVAFSYQGFTRPGFMEKFSFRVGSILHGKEWFRMISSGFLHVDWSHLFMNMLSLYFCGEGLELVCKISMGKLWGLAYIGLYLASLLGGNLLALLLQRKNANYSAVGASGAVSGMIFAFVVLFPKGFVYLFFAIPVPIWLFAILYIAYSIYGIRTRLMNIGHEAHLGGALVGLGVAASLWPESAKANWIFLVAISVPTLIMLFLLYQNPLLGSNPAAYFKNFKLFRKKPRPFSSNPNAPKPPVKQDGLEVNMRAQLQMEMDQLLEKVAKKGEASLSPKERARLQELADYLNRPGNISGNRAPSQ